MPRGWCDHRSMMKPVTYVLQFRGRANRWPTRRTVAELSAPSTALVTMLGSSGVSAGYELSPGGEARLRSQVTVRGELLEAQSTVSFGDGHELRIRTVEPAHLVATPDPHLSQASVVSEVIGGRGQFRDARGRIVSNLLISDTGEVTDNHLGVIFVEGNT